VKPRRATSAVPVDLAAPSEQSAGAGASDLSRRRTANRLGTSAQTGVNRAQLATISRVAAGPHKPPENSLQIRTNDPARPAALTHADRASHARGRWFETTRAHAVLRFYERAIRRLVGPFVGQTTARSPAPRPREEAHQLPSHRLVGPQVEFGRPTIGRALAEDRKAQHARSRQSASKRDAANQRLCRHPHDHFPGVRAKREFGWSRSTAALVERGAGCLDDSARLASRE
jgi:hypothetical protein